MKIIFVQENKELIALSLNEILNGFHNEEMHWATISGKHKKFFLRWEDNYSNQLVFPTLEDAKAHVLVNYERHTPLINGKSVEVDLGGSQTLEV
jgi:hypothetical protein